LDTQDERQRLALAITAIQDGNLARARRLINSVLRDNPRNLAAWSWACEIAPTRDEQIHCLQQMLAIDPAHAQARRYLGQLQTTLSPAHGPADPLPPPTVIGAPLPSENGVGQGLTQWLLMPLGCLLQASVTHLVVVVLALILGAGIVYYTANTSFLGLAGADFDSLTISPSYEQIEARDLYWKITFEKKGDSQYEGLVRHVSPIRINKLRILTHDILVTSGDYADPALVHTSVFNHKFMWRSTNTARPQGSINLVHTIPANEEIYRQLLGVRRGDKMVIAGREVLKITAYDPSGSYLGEWHDTGCNTLLVNSVTISPQ
jgi:hypothetical protein